MANSTWTGAAADNDWNNASNWSSGVPTGADTATFTTNATPMNNQYTVQVGTIYLVGASRTVSITGIGTFNTDANAVGISVSFNSIGQVLLIAPAIEGDNGMAIVGSGGSGGTLTLAGYNTFDGTFLFPLISGTPSCTVQITNEMAFGTSTISMNSGTLNLNTKAVPNNITYRGGTISNASAYQGIVSLAGTATLTVGTNITNTFHGTVSVSTGTTMNIAGNTLPSAVVTMNGGTLVNAASYSGTTQVGAGGTFTISSPIAGTVSVPTASTLNANVAAGATVNNLTLQEGSYINIISA